MNIIQKNIDNEKQTKHEYRHGFDHLKMNQLFGIFFTSQISRE